MDAKSRTERPTELGRTPYYSRDVDFRVLAKKDADFAQAWKKATSRDTGFIDFQNEAFVQQLTKSLLKADFNLKLTLPPDRLCPPVPVRWNYIRWLQDLIDGTRPWAQIDEIVLSDVPDVTRDVTGLDIGVGASCIYSLLACASRPKWSMIGTDVDDHSLSFAHENVALNDFSDRIRLKKMAASDPLIDLDGMNCQTLDFVMTNPPFYSSQEDMVASYAGKKLAPSAVCLGSENEMICPGGDLGFASRILDESLRLRERVQWYSAMMGRLKSAEELVTRLKAAGVTNFAASDLQAGYKTKRWAIAWSFCDFRPRNEVSRHGELTSSIMPWPSLQVIHVPLQDAKWSAGTINRILTQLKVDWQWRPLLNAGVMACTGDVWSRAARRKELQRSQEDQTTSTAPSQNVPTPAIALCVSISCLDQQVEVRWLRGHQRLLFESFCGKMKRALTGHG